MGFNAVVLAAGQGTRMKSDLHKVLHPICGKPMVVHILDQLKEIGVDRTVVVIGHGAETVRETIGERAEFALQEEQLGTGHAVMQATPLLEGEDGLTLVIYGDMPLLEAESIRKLRTEHTEKGAAVTLLTADMPDPTGYGRIIRDASDEVSGIVEHKDCTPEQRAIVEINTGVYCFDSRELWSAIAQLNNNNAQGEYYLTDVIAILKRKGKQVAGSKLADYTESLGVNDRAALAEAEAAMRRRINRNHMLAGVTLVDPASTYIEADVQIGKDTIVEPGAILRGRTVVGERCRIGSGSDITDSIISSGTKIQHSVLLGAEVGQDVSIGPFAYLRPGTKLADHVKVGDFVEVKNAVIGEGSKLPHLSYVGDATVGRGVNIGCGVITANYDGFHKHRTEIEDDVFIGSNSNLIAPVRVGKGAYVVAGSTITSDVEADALAIARSRQTNKPGYASRLRGRIQGKKQD